MIPTLSVITLTHDRLAMLQRCLERLLPQLGADDEIVVVDTGSTDGTREHFHAGAPDPRVRFFDLDLAAGGGSWAEARNFGVARARGQMIAFLDDDCMVAPDWVARGKAALADADAVGGIARASGIAAFPRWWRPEMSWMVGLSGPGHAGPDAGRVHYPMTCNLWARAAACRAVPFQEIGGRLQGQGTGNYLAGREDAQWWRALRVDGYRTRFDPELWVGHAIDPARLSLDYLRGRAEGDGRSWAAREGLAEDAAPTAYGWWHHLGQQMLTPFQEEGTWLCHWHFHRLCRLRQGAALRGLAEKRGRRPKLAAPALQWAFWRAGARWAADRGRTLARFLLRPWLVARPAHGAARPVERVAVIAFGYLGDMVILQEILLGLAKEHCHLTIHVLTPPSTRLGLGRVPRMTVSHPPSNVDPKTREDARWLARWLHDVRPDAIVAPYLNGPWGKALTALRRPPRPIVGFDQDCGLEHRRHYERLSVRVHKNLELHEKANLKRLFEWAGLPCEPRPAELRPDPAALTRARSCPFVADAPRGAPLVMFNPDAGHAQKEWPDERWTGLTRLALDRTDWRIVINASRPRAELEERVATVGPGGRVHWLRAAPLEDLMAWMSLCAALATVDAGPQHLAHGLGVPSVTLYGPMDERRWRDGWRRPIHRTIRACAFDLTPDERRGLAVNHQVALIEPEAVFAELRGLLPS